MLARVLSAAVNGIEAFPVEVEVNSGWGDTMVMIKRPISPILVAAFYGTGKANCLLYEIYNRRI
jgi:hypothetical protein